MEKLEDTASVVRCRIKVKPLAQWDVKREFLRRLKFAFDENNLEFPFPHMVMYPGQDKQGNVESVHVTEDASSPQHQTAAQEPPKKEAARK